MALVIKNPPANTGDISKPLLPFNLKKIEETGRLTDTFSLKKTLGIYFVKQGKSVQDVFISVQYVLHTELKVIF